MKRLAILSFLLSTLLYSTTALCENVDRDRFILTTISSIAEQSHPRLILNEESIARLKEAASNDEVVSRMCATVIHRADKVLDKPITTYNKQGRRILSVSRQIEERVTECALAYILTADARYAKRAEEEMFAACSFESWNPSHFLDVAEMTAALAIGYDWLYDALNPTSREKIARAIISKGLNGAEDEKQLWFYRSANNWNQVCNAGLVLGALAVGEQCPDCAATIVRKALDTNPLAMACYAPDGVYPEGFSYWDYGTWYEVLLIEALRSIFGTDFDIASTPGFMASARFMNFMVAPSLSCFNFSDCPARAPVNPLLFWFAAEQRDRSLISFDVERILAKRHPSYSSWRLLAIATVFASRCTDLPNDREHYAQKCFVGLGQQSIFIYRSGLSPTDTYLSFKGGSASSNHAHMDAGEFIFERDGVRWSCDLGAQNYHSLESKGVDLWNKRQHSQRWSVFRLGASAHSTLTVDGRPHLVDGMATLCDIKRGEGGTYGATIDLSSVLPDISQALRTFSLQGERLTVSDRVTASNKTCCRMRWTICTRASISIVNRNTIILSADNKTLTLRASGVSGIRAFSADNTPPHSYDEANPDSRRAGFVFNVPAGKTRTIKVALE